MMISKFWKALDELSDAGSSRHGWGQRLGDEWKAVVPFLPATGKLAASLACPNPGAAGCPRRVVQHGDGTASAGAVLAAAGVLLARFWLGPGARQSVVLKIALFGALVSASLPWKALVNVRCQLEHYSSQFKPY